MVTTHGFCEALAAERVVAIIRGTDIAAMVAAGLTLIESGVRCLEVSLSANGAPEVIATLARAAGEDAWVGAGTVLTADDVNLVAEAGARFIVTPTVSESLDTAHRLGLPALGGALTPTEVDAARQKSAAVKLFPASVFGPGYVSALRAPFPGLLIVPVGGIGVDSAADYLAAGALAVGIGSPLLGDAGDGGSLSALRDRAHDFLSACR
jgi:2-dehydro-3-deoxyphosphogluconate aldolase/(4S)-4-hydroxy-2-oxoglutarate aldolase